MNKMALYLGILLVIIALILGGVQYGTKYFNIYGSSTTKYEYYGGVALIGLIGIIIAAWGSMKKPAITQPKPVATQTPAQT